MPFTWFIDLPPELQGKILGYLNPADWANAHRVSQGIGNICEIQKVREDVFASHTFPLSLPQELEFIRIRTEGKPYLDPEFLATEGYDGYFLVGAAYNFDEIYINESWYNDKELPVIYFAMFVYIMETYTVGCNKLRLGDGHEIYSLPWGLSPDLDGEWKKWKGQYLWENISDPDESGFVIPCNLWLYPYNTEIFDEDEDEYYIVLKYDGLFPVLNNVKPIQSLTDMENLYQSLKLLTTK